LTLSSLRYARMLLLKHIPDFSLEDAVALAVEIYGLTATATALPSERDQNFLLETDSNERYVLKIANALEDRSLLEAQNAALAHLAHHTSLCPRILPARSGQLISQIDSRSGAQHFVRLVTYLPGKPLASAAPYSPELLRDLGSAVAQVDRALASFDHPAIHRDFHWDLANGLREIRRCAPLVADGELRSLIYEEAEHFERDVTPLLSNLRKSAIHNDANDYNILSEPPALAGGPASSDQHVTGLIDFGDMVHSYTVADLAIAVAYTILDHPDPVVAATHVVFGYHSEYPLSENEMAVVFDLARLRLCLSVCLAAQQRRQRPENDYLSISQQSIRSTLPKLVPIDPHFAEAAFRQACQPERKELSRAQTLAARRKLIGTNVSLAYAEPLKIVRGWMQYLYDENGRQYLDAYNNVPHMGHCHPRVVKAGQEQMALLNTNTRYLHDLINQYAEGLCNTLPNPLSVCFFVNSGSEANELALRLAHAYTSKRDLIVLEHAYHGNTTTLIDISPYKHNGPGGKGPPSWVHAAPIADVYRGPYKRDDAEAGAKYAQHVVEIIERLRANDVGLAGFIAESWPSVAGQIMFPEGYLPRVYAAVREAGGLCIADEVQTGYGRIGTHFWGFEAYAVVPDIVVLGKPIGNGHPIGVVITTPEIAASFDNGMEFFSTFGGNTVSCAIGLAVLNVVQEENLQAHALRVGHHLLAGLRSLQDRHPIIGDVRGSGLFLGVELVRNRETLEPAAQEASFIVNRMRDRGILLGTDGPFHNVIKIRPPMPFSLHDADQLVGTMQTILAEHFVHIKDSCRQQSTCADRTLPAKS
jgi:4-aminobutyrate aminotransferase-like enzyme/Ser/Thr protein kinase RdoA (MazF antagonist)